MIQRGIFYFLGSLLLIFALTSGLSNPKKKSAISLERVKVALREVGNQLLLTHKDSTSLIRPVIAVNSNTFQLSFESSLSFDPEDLDVIMKTQLEKATLPLDYLVEVIDCTEQEVSYSYYRNNTTDNNMIPCSGRTLPEKCYLIEIQFTEETTATSFSKTTTLITGFSGLLFLLIGFYKNKNTTTDSQQTSKKDPGLTIGHFKFYPEQNKLIKEAIEIQLSKKECELLAIFVENPNQVIKRDELSKRVWEDHGVIVGRSLDTYVSKLRKILKEDTNIKLVNVHGVGYKLEIKNHLS